MPTITINGHRCEFTPGENILQVANREGIEIPQYCYHDSMSVVASCRICLGEVWAPNPRSGGKLEPFMGGKLLPTCQTQAQDGMVVHTDTPKSVANQKSVMEYLLINHPLDCPVCDQSGECFLQDYSYKYGRGVSRFQEQKVKQPKKDLGPHVYLYADRCIMCTRCVRFTREVTETSELMVESRGNRVEIDVFPGVALDNELSANVIDLCPVGALLDKDFLFAQRVWFLKRTASIDGITASGDNLWIEHNEGRIYRLKPRENMNVNKWWLTDEVRYGWKFVHDEQRLGEAMMRRYGTLSATQYPRAVEAAAAGLREHAGQDKRLLLVVSPMLSCEDAYALAEAALQVDERAVLAVGPVPYRGEDKLFPPGDEDGFRLYAEKAPNARGVRRVLEGVAEARGVGEVLDFDAAMGRLGGDDVGAVILTGNYPSAWATDELLGVLDRGRGGPGGAGRFVVLLDTLRSPLVDLADVVLPGVTWAEKAGTFENARNMLQAFEQAIPAVEGARPEGQIAHDLIAAAKGPVASARIFNAADVRDRMSGEVPALSLFATDVIFPGGEGVQDPDMTVVEL